MNLDLKRQRDGVMVMSLYLVRNNVGTPVWIAHEDGEMRIWTYLQNTGKFHLNRDLYRDFYFEHANTYTPITDDEALQSIREGVGRLDERTVGHLIAQFQADPAARPIGEIVGLASHPSARQHAEADERS